MSAPAVALEEEAVLGVRRSLRGQRWLARDGDARVGMALAQRLELPEIVGRVLAARGVGLDEAEAFLEPTLKALLPDPSRLRDMDRAAARLARAVEGGEAIAVFGDYDVDGATSAAILARFFAAVGCPIRVYVPDRLREGYGPNAAALMRLRAEGVRVVVTVDCGTTAHDALEVAAEAGLDVIVVDHHVVEPRLPPCFAVINPNRLDEDGSLGQLAAVGVAFLLAVAVNRALRAAGHYRHRPEPDLKHLLDLVALGTVCDMVPLVGLNRAFVRQGLKVMAGRRNAGLAALADLARVSEAPNAYHLGFIIGPRVNAGGRVGKSDLGARLLSTGDAVEAAELARRLDAHNQERKALEREVLDAARHEAEAADAGAPLIFVAGEGWHPGVIGIVAGRLVERFHRPACVVALDGAEGKGSGRSVAGVDLGAAVIAARQAGLLTAGGGHPMAAGFTVARAQLGELVQFLAERVAAAMRAVVPTLSLDGAMTVGGADLGLVTALERLAPFGAGNAEPRFALPAARLVRADVVGDGHVRGVLADGGGGRLKAIAFRAAGEPMGEALMNAQGRPLHLAGRVRRDTWRGGSAVQFMIDDAAWP
ncbi:MAG: single-stranded-DNA-specific exonuclease RecJ [Alphaproteobacteria bacterium]